MMRPGPVLATAVAALLSAAAAAQDAAPPWDPEFYDPGAAWGDAPAADLVLPMPCGGAMAFQRVEVSVEGAGPLADRELRLGQSDTDYGYMDYLRRDYLRGAFEGPDGAGTHFYLGRYEMTEMQHAALTDPACGAAPSIEGTLPRLGLSWFEAIDLSRAYSEWLRAAAPEALPMADGRPGFLRLPTEAEWEFAARGGEAVDPLDFGGARPPMDGELAAHAQFDQDVASPVGAHRPNPLSIFDMLGNAEELVAEPFRLNAVGHVHGQIGGLVTRGGSFLGGAADMRSSRRTEWPPYDDRTGRAQAQETFGLRLVVSAQVMTGDARVDAVGQAWARTRAGAGAPADQALPVDRIADLAAQELDPTRRSALEAIQLTLSQAQDAAQRAERAQVAATLEMAAVIVGNIELQNRRVEGPGGLRDYLARTEARLAEETRASPGAVARDRESAEATIAEFRDRIADLEGLVRDLLGSYREALTVLTSIDPAALDGDLALFDRRLSSRGNDVLVLWAILLRGDLLAFAEAPDMDAEALLRLALE